ncbi:MAG TPA: c-type cytochrome [Vicinamibacterales bacterium]|nr:c-type cytochrome [Vicinamibacterales bacterium]
MLFAVSACRGGDPQLAIALNASSGGDPARGSAVIQQYGCGSCHLIPGIAGASSLVGPPLISFSRRSFVGGELPNTPDNVASFIRTPQHIHPHSAMPTVGLSQEQARDVVAYLYTLR